MVPGTPIPPHLPEAGNISFKEALIVIIPTLLMITVIVAFSNLLIADFESCA